MALLQNPNDGHPDSGAAPILNGSQGGGVAAGGVAPLTRHPAKGAAPFAQGSPSGLAGYDGGGPQGPVKHQVTRSGSPLC